MSTRRSTHTLFPSIPLVDCPVCFQMLNERHVMVRVGGGWETFISYLQKHDPCRGGAAGGKSEVRVCRGKVKSPTLSMSPDSYMVVGAHYRSKKWSLKTACFGFLEGNISFCQVKLCEDDNSTFRFLTSVLKNETYSTKELVWSLCKIQSTQRRRTWLYIVYLELIGN